MDSVIRLDGQLSDWADSYKYLHDIRKPHTYGSEHTSFLISGRLFLSPSRAAVSDVFVPDEATVFVLEAECHDDDAQNHTPHKAKHAAHDSAQEVSGRLTATTASNGGRFTCGSVREAERDTVREAERERDTVREAERDTVREAERETQ